MTSDNIHTVFISSTFEDLTEERAAVQKAVLRLGCLPIGMELFPSADDDAWGFIKGEIERSDYYILIVGNKYGSVAKDGISFTEKEYRYAKRLKKPRLVFIRSDIASASPKKQEKDESKRKRLHGFVNELKSSRLVMMFENHDQLGGCVLDSLSKLRSNNPAPGYVRQTDVISDGAVAKWMNKVVADGQEILASLSKGSIEQDKQEHKNRILGGSSARNGTPSIREANDVSKEGSFKQTDGQHSEQRKYAETGRRRLTKLRKDVLACVASAQHSNESTNVQLIASKLDVDPESVTRALQDLEQMGLVLGPGSLLVRCESILNSSDTGFKPGSTGYNAAVILLASALTKADEGFLARELSYDSEFVTIVGARLRTAGIWKGSALVAGRKFAWKSTVDFVADALVANGDFVRIGGTIKDPIYYLTATGKNRYRSKTDNHPASGEAGSPGTISTTPHAPRKSRPLRPKQQSH